MWLYNKPILIIKKKKFPFYCVGLNRRRWFSPFDSDGVVILSGLHYYNHLPIFKKKIQQKKKTGRGRRVANISLFLSTLLAAPLECPQFPVCCWAGHLSLSL